MGLTKRGSYNNETLTVTNVSVNQTDNFTMHETSGFVTLIIPTAQILQTKACADSKQLLQPFYRVDVVLTFKETNHKMHWTMENTLPCTVRPAAPHTTAMSTLNPKRETFHSDQRSSDRSAVTEGNLNERLPLEEISTTESPHTLMETPSFNLHTDEMSESQSGNFSYGFDGDSITSINATETSFFDFLNTITNTSAEPPFNESSATAEPSETSLLTTNQSEPEYQQFNTTSGNQDQQKQRLKWIWKN
uniref:uncharacterized protein C1orf127 homolog n=1 Tax=Scatophagus argus TaxID=75038 RepID=UPI001ED7D436|nr:uncharacterized protein C1orf127 homolog [Scatophagus argus]